MKEIAQLVRQFIKEQFPTYKFSVRTSYASMCQELHVAMAVSAAKRSLIFNPNTAGDAEGVIVYDLRRRKIADIFGYFPERYRPAEA